jgi:hypothetical protein
MANTMTLISSVTVGSGGAASIDFSSIPATYTDLCLKVSARGASAGSGTSGVWDNVQIKFNGSTSNFTYRTILDIDGSASSNSGSIGILGWTDFSGATASTFGNIETYIPNYAGSNNKSFSTDSTMENNGTPIVLSCLAQLWSSTAAINQITILPNSGNFAQYSTAYLYGVKNA